MSFFIFLMVRIAAEVPPLLIFGGLVVAIITLVLLKGIWDGIVSLRYRHCLRIQGDSIHMGLVPKALLPAADSIAVQALVPDSAVIDAAFRSQKRLDLSRVSRVQYSWRGADRQSASQEVLLLSEEAAAETDNLASGNVRFSQLLKTAGTLREDILTLRLNGLSVGETMAFERILELEIARRGGAAL